MFMTKLRIKNNIITDEKLDLILEIYKSDLPDLEKTLKLERIISYKDLKDYIYYKNINKLNVNDKIVRVYNIYENFKKIGFFKDWYKCDIEELEKRLNNLNIIYQTLKSDLPEDEKIRIVFSIYKDVNEFNKKYALLIKFGANDSRLDSAREALDNFDFISNTLNSIPEIQIRNLKYRNEIETILEENNYLENYLYAEFVIKMYISDDKSYLKNKFLQNMGINNETFAYCERLISFINPVLYKEYQDCVSKNNKNRAYAIGMTIRNLAYGINTGCLYDGTELTLLEFYKRIPFKEYGTKFISTLRDFIARNIGYDDGIYYTINNYLYHNNITNIIPANETELINSSISVAGVKLTKEIIHNIFRYMEINDLPKIMPVYRIVLRQYINKEIDFSLLDEQEKQNKMSQKVYNNPYTLVLKNN